MDTPGTSQNTEKAKKPIKVEKPPFLDTSIGNQQWKTIGKVGKLYLYPLEGGHPKSVKELRCTSTGCMEIGDDWALLDRSFIVYKHNLITDHKRAIIDEPMLAPISITRKGFNVTISSLRRDCNETIKINLEQEIQNNSSLVAIYYEKSVAIPEDVIHVKDCGEEVSKFFTRLMIQPPNATEIMRLGFYQPTLTRLEELHNRLYDSVGYDQDLVYTKASQPRYSACAIVNEESVNLVKKESRKKELKAKYFRPNVVIKEGTCAPFTEDKIKTLKIGSNTILCTKILCCRKEYVCANPKTGEGVEPNSGEPYTYLLNTRALCRVNPNYSLFLPVFGINMKVFQEGTIKVNDTIEAQFTD